MFPLSPPSSHLFDTIFVLILFSTIMCTGKSSSHGSSSSGSPSSNDHRHFFRGASFMDLMLDPNHHLSDELIKSASSNNRKINDEKSPSSPNKTPQTKASTHQKHPCQMLSSMFGGNQVKFCHRHQDLLVTILPQVIQLTRKECARITSDLRWNCSVGSIDHLMDRSNPLAFTKEATLVRSILNAAMVYLVLRTCSDRNYHGSCGCQNHNDFNSIPEPMQQQANNSTSWPNSGGQESDSEIEFPLDHIRDFSQADLLKLNSGSPLRLTNSMVRRRQSCLANIGFAIAFTKVFLDSDDNRALKRASGILNEEGNYLNSNLKRILDSDNKDLAYIKWSKSAINLHNNHAGRQMVREVIQRRCRCHGLSGVCGLQTCWDQVMDFEIVTTRLRSIYLGDNITKVEVKNVGSHERPDLRLTTRATQTLKSNRLDESNQLKLPTSSNEDVLLSLNTATAEHEQQINGMVKSGDLIYLYDSPEYCDPVAKIKHPGTKGRLCKLTAAERAGTGTGNAENLLMHDNDEQQSTGSPGSCEQLCCNRGCQEELVMDLVACNCRFKFCCEVKCDQCLRQRVQHFCL